MKRKYLLISGIALSTAEITTYLLKQSSNRVMAKMMMKDFKEKVIPIMKKDQNSPLPVEKAGHPDPLDIEDNEMVSEGSIYPVNYYNEKQ